MTKEEFINNIKLLIKYNGDVEEFININFNNLEVEFNLNSPFVGVFTEDGAKEYNEHLAHFYNPVPEQLLKKEGDEIHTQFHHLFQYKEKGSITLPFVKCRIGKNNKNY